MGLADAIEKAIGVNDKNQAPTLFLSTGFPLLNHSLSGKYLGGLPMGRVIEMFGPSSAGKTAIASELMISAQEAGGIAMFNDHERSFDVRLSIKAGLDTDPNHWVFKTPRTFEESIDNSVKLIQTVREGKFIDPEAPIIIVFDSLASMVPASKIDKARGELTRHDNTALARCTAAAFPAFTQWCADNNVLALFLNQIRTKIGVMFGDPTTTPGGNAPEFYSSIRIKLGKSQIAKGKGPDKVILGSQIGAETVKNKTYRPFQKVKWNFMFREDGSGHFDVVGSTIDHLVAEGILTNTKGRISYIDGSKLMKGQLVKKIDESLDMKEELFNLLPGYLDEVKCLKAA